MANQDSEKVFDCRDTLEGQGLSGNWLEVVHSLVKPVWDREVKAYRKANLGFDSPPVPGRPDHKRMVLPVSQALLLGPSLLSTGLRMVRRGAAQIWEQQNLVGDIDEEIQDVNELN